MSNARSGGSPALTFAVLLGLLVALLGAAEAWARWRWSETDLLPVPDMPFLQDDPWLLWRTRPDLSGPTRERWVLTTNHEGLRAPELGPKVGLRVLSLGESSTWGYRVGDDETYSARLQARLRADGLDVEVINAGQPAWSVWQSATFLNLEGAAWAPDVVLVYHLANDVQRRGASNPRDPFHQALSDRQLTEARAPFARLSGLLAQSRLRAVLWKEVLAPRLATAPGGAADTVRVPDADRALALASIRSWCAAHDARLVLIQPVYAQEPDRFVPAWAAQNGLPLVDLPARKRAEGVADFFMVDDTHPTPAGHEWIAGQLETALLPTLRELAAAR